MGYYVESLELAKKDAINTAKELFYSKECIRKLEKATNLVEIEHILIEERRKR